jgi:RimJ/RimL family protein N-acetyltransferase
MAWADFAIAAAGTTAWELAFMGLPAIVLTLADNQIEVAASLNCAGTCDSLAARGKITTQTIAAAATSLMFDQSRREQMSRLGRQLVDGLGCERVLTRMRSADIHLRAARDEDSHTVWQWANDSETRAMSFNSEPIAWEDHLQWYRSKLMNPRCFFYIATDEQCRPIGQVRFDLDDAQAVISVGLASEARGRSLASPVVVRALDELFTESDVSEVHAYVKPTNQASIRTFLKADFDELEMAAVRGGEAKHFGYFRKTQ